MDIQVNSQMTCILTQEAAHSARSGEGDKIIRGESGCFPLRKAKKAFWKRHHLRWALKDLAGPINKARGGK